MKYPELAEKVKEAGFFQWGPVSLTDAALYDEVRELCRKNICRRYGATWACPPAVGSLAQCRDRLSQYRTAILFSAKYALADSFDYDGMTAAHISFKRLCDKLYDSVTAALPRFLLLSNEGCIRCGKCTYPDQPCRFPEKLFPSLDGFGFHVNELASSAGISYINGPNTVTYFGMLLV